MANVKQNSETGSAAGSAQDGTTRRGKSRADNGGLHSVAAQSDGPQSAGKKGDTGAADRGGVEPPAVMRRSGGGDDPNPVQRKRLNGPPTTVRPKARRKMDEQASAVAGQRGADTEGVQARAKDAETPQETKGLGRFGAVAKAVGWASKKPSKPESVKSRWLKQSGLQQLYQDMSRNFEEDFCRRKTSGISNR